jgi:hypothetical protein
VDATNHQVLTYWSVRQTLDQLKACLADGYPVVFGFTVYESFESPRVAKTGIVPMPGPGERALGGHAVMAVGYEEAKKEGPAALEMFFFDPENLYANQPCAKLPVSLKGAYQAAKREGPEAVAKFLFEEPDPERPGQKRVDTALKPACEEAQKRGDRAVEIFLFGPPTLDPAKRCARLDPALKEAYETARTASDQALDGFFQERVRPARWCAWLCLLGLVVIGPLLSFPLRPLLRKHNGRLLFIFGLTGLLGGYFWFLAGNGIYPMGIDLAGGTELIYRLDFTDVDRRIDEATRQLNELTAKGAKEDEVRKVRSQLESLKQSKDTAPEKATEVVRKRVDPTGAKGVPITSYDEGRRIRIQLPKASPEEVERIKRAIRTQGRLTFHLVADKDKQSDIIRRVEDPKNERHEYQGYELMVIEKKDPYDPKHVSKENVVIEKLPMLGGERVVFAGTARNPEGGYEVRKPANRLEKDAGSRMTDVNHRLLKQLR